MSKNNRGAAKKVPVEPRELDQPAVKRHEIDQLVEKCVQLVMKKPKIAASIIQRLIKN